VVDASGRLSGIVTDGDLRRHMAPDLMTRSVDEVMTAGPRTIRPDALVSEALEVMETNKITALFAVENGKPVGLIHMHDLLRIGLV
jgi:arabinose-5-phosphate isomerase